MITYENALKLKEAGFPQPEAEFGQKWYYKNPDLPVRFVLVGTAEWNLVSYKNEMLAYAPTALEILRQMEGYLTDGVDVFEVSSLYEIYLTAKGGGNLDNVVAYLWCGGTEYKGVKYLTGKGTCPENVTMDGSALECGEMHLWKTTEQGVENGIYEVTAIEGAVKGFAGTYTPLP